MKNKVLAFILAGTMVVQPYSVVSAAEFSDGEEQAAETLFNDDTDEIPEVNDEIVRTDEEMNQFSTEAAGDESGNSKPSEDAIQMGDDVWFTFDESTGTATVSGTGDMWDYYDNGYDYTNTHKNPFIDKNGIKKIVVSDGITSVGSYFLYNYNDKGSIEEVELSDNIKNINEYAFYWCYNIKCINLPERLETIRESSFTYCKSLTEINFPETLKVIDDFAFQECYGLTEINFPSQLTTLGLASFKECKNIEKIFLPKTLKKVTDQVFDGCTNLKEINIEEGFSCNLPFYFFHSCTSLRDVIIPKSVPALDGYLFTNCSRLTTITIEGETTRLSSSVFDTCPNLRTIKGYDCSFVKRYYDSVAETDFSRVKFESLGEGSHEFSSEKVQIKDPTCIEKGIKAYECVWCGKTKDEEEVPELGHNWDSGKTLKYQTCTEDGEIMYSCQRCGETRTEVLPATGHKEVIDEAIEPTCEENGKTEGSHCRTCGEILKAQEIIPATGHKEVIDEAVEATCEESGKTEGSHCEICGKVLKAQEEISPIGHDYGEWEIIKEATYTETGKAERICRRDSNHIETKILPVKERKEIKVEFTASPSGNTMTGEEVKLTANATGGSGEFTYKFLVCDAQGNWYRLRDYEEGNTFIWTTGAVGKKTLFVDVKDSIGTIKRAELSYEVKNAEISVIFMASPLDGVVSGQRVQLMAGAVGGSGGFTYKFIVCDDKGNWYKLRDFEKSNTFIWTTGSAGKKTLYVDVKDSKGRVKREQLSYEVQEKGLRAGLQADPETAAASGTIVKLTATAAGGSGFYTYKFLICDDKGNWYKIRDYATSNTCTWVPGSTGKKTLYVDVKDGSGTVKRVELPYEVKKKEPQIELKVDSMDDIVNGKQVKVEANVTDGEGAYIYKFIICDDKGNWYKLRDYELNNTYIWTPGTAGKKTLYVDVKDFSGRVVRQSLDIVVKDLRK